MRQTVLLPLAAVSHSGISDRLHFSLSCSSRFSKICPYKDIATISRPKASTISGGRWKTNLQEIFLCFRSAPTVGSSHSFQLFNNCSTAKASGNLFEGTVLTRIIHERVCCIREVFAATSLWRARLATRLRNFSTNRHEQCRLSQLSGYTSHHNRMY